MTGLPRLPQNNGSSVKLFRQILLAYLVRSVNSSGEIKKSQRDLAAFFNRDGELYIGRHLNRLCRSGYLVKVQKSTGALPDTYILGERLSVPGREFAYYSSLGEALYSDSGLVTALGRNEAFGCGCLNDTGVLVLGTLICNCNAMYAWEITDYLNGLVSSRTVARILSVLQDAQIIDSHSGVIGLCSSWRTSLEGFLASNRACCPRQLRGDKRRKIEQEKNIARLNRGMLTGAERTFLRGQRCVYCNADGIQQQHFPPRRFLDGFEIINNKHFIWPICRSCNDSEKNFIRAIPNLPTLELVNVQSSGTLESDLLLLYREVSEVGIWNFHVAHQNGDLAAAHRAVLYSHTLWKSLEHLGVTNEYDRIDEWNKKSAELTLRIPLRRKRNCAGDYLSRTSAWLTAKVLLNGDIAEFVYHSVGSSRDDSSISKCNHNYCNCDDC